MKCDFESKFNIGDRVFFIDNSDYTCPIICDKNKKYEIYNIHFNVGSYDNEIYTDITYDIMYTESNNNNINKFSYTIMDIHENNIFSSYDECLDKYYEK